MAWLCSDEIVGRQLLPGRPISGRHCHSSFLACVQVQHLPARRSPGGACPSKAPLSASKIVGLPAPAQLLGQQAWRRHQEPPGPLSGPAMSLAQPTSGARVRGSF